MAIAMTMGDLLTAGACLLATCLYAGDTRWPLASFGRVTVLTAAAGVGYMIFSEWPKTVVRVSWAYAAAIPQPPMVEIGLTPVLQWIIVPSVAFRFEHHPFGTS